MGRGLGRGAGTSDGGGASWGGEGLREGRAGLRGGRAGLREERGVRAVKGYCVFVHCAFQTSDLCSLLHRITGCLVGMMVFSHRLDS